MDRQKTVLIIEDSKTQAAVISDIVARIGFVPKVVNQVTTAVPQILAAVRPLLVLLDLRLLDEHGKIAADGFQICREIKRAEQNLPVVIVSSESDDDACEWAIMQGADAFLQKPFVAEDLKQVITEVLGKYGLTTSIND